MNDAPKKVDTKKSNPKEAAINSSVPAGLASGVLFETNAPQDDVSLQILDAASKRFLHYGYNKTTMSEIAKDCNMSTGNLYRFFPAKLDIAEGFVRVLRTEQMSKLKLALDEPNLGAADRLRKHDFAIDWANAEARVMAEIVAVGVQEGVFPAGDNFAQAHLIQNACFRFTTPAIFLDGEIEDLSKELDELIDLLLEGLAARANKALS